MLDASSEEAMTRIPFNSRSNDTEVIMTTKVHRFYLHGSYKEGSDTLPNGEFTFVVDEFRDLEVPSFLIWFYRDMDGMALLCKIRRITRPADLGMKVHVYDALPIRLVSHGLLNSVYPDSHKTVGMSARAQADEIILMRDIFTVPDEKSDLVKNAILKNNPVLDESYFLFDQQSFDTELLVQATDAFYTGVRIFGIPSKDIPELREQQILDFDIATIFSDAKNLGASPDGKHFFEHAGKRLYLHKVDHTPIEECLGVDLIYNFYDQRRLVFVQYKCQRVKGKYYPSSDASHESEIQRMTAIPGLANCINRLHDEQDWIRLCRCPVFIKLCKREIAHTHAVPIGVYYPLCVWQWHTRRGPGISVKDEPHLNNQQFQELVKTGLIGSTQAQSHDIHAHLVVQANDSRLKLIFEERNPG